MASQIWMCVRTPAVRAHRVQTNRIKAPASAMASPLSDRTNKKIDATAPTAKHADLFSPIPPPPAEVNAKASALDTALSHVPTLSKNSLAGLMAGHVAVFVMSVSGVSPLAIVSWLALLLLVGNGVATTVVTRSGHAGETREAIITAIKSNVETTVDAGLNLFDRFKCGEPRLTFCSAVAAWGLTIASSHLSIPSLAWLLSAIATAGCSLKYAHELGRLNELAPKAAALQATLVGLTAQVKVPPAAAQLAAYAPLVPVLVWLFVLGWYHKLLTAGLGLLAYKAWARPEDVQSLNDRFESMSKSETVGNIKKGARRRTPPTFAWTH